jgi:legumain
MIKNGIPAEQIILFNYDDAASSLQNFRHRGKLFNKPTEKGDAGVDVHEGCNIDYKYKNVDATNILKALQGDESAGGKVLKSNENSKVFFYYADHGAPGILGTPVGPYIYADQLNKAFKFMQENKMYKEMVVYIEACESGSIFENILADDMNIYAVTAANASESSWGTYCSPNDKVDGKHVGSCLGDLFSVNWMEDSDKANMSTETLQDQYETVKTQTAKSHVLQWGQLSLTEEPIGDFEAANVDSSKPHKFWKQMKRLGKKFLKKETDADEHLAKKKNEFAVDSRDINLHYLYARMMEDSSLENA